MRESASRVECQPARGISFESPAHSASPIRYLRCRSVHRPGRVQIRRIRYYRSTRCRVELVVAAWGEDTEYRIRSPGPAPDRAKGLESDLELDRDLGQVQDQVQGLVEDPAKDLELAPARDRVGGKHRASKVPGRARGRVPFPIPGKVPDMAHKAPQGRAGKEDRADMAGKEETAIRRRRPLPSRVDTEGAEAAARWEDRADYLNSPR
jgi:hypothetical protein